MSERGLVNLLVRWFLVSLSVFFVFQLVGIRVLLPKKSCKNFQKMKKSPVGLFILYHFVSSASSADADNGRGLLSFFGSSFSTVTFNVLSAFFGSSKI